MYSAWSVFAEKRQRAVCMYVCIYVCMLAVERSLCIVHGPFSLKSARELYVYVCLYLCMYACSGEVALYSAWSVFAEKRQRAVCMYVCIYVCMLSVERSLCIVHGPFLLKSARELCVGACLYMFALVCVCMCICVYVEHMYNLHVCVSGCICVYACLHIRIYASFGIIYTFHVQTTVLKHTFFFLVTHASSECMQASGECMQA